MVLALVWRVLLFDMSSGDVVLAVEQLDFSYSLNKAWWSQKAHRQVLYDINLRLARGRTLGIVGESGSGKSTLARCILALQRPQRGRILFAGEDLARLSQSRMRPLRRKLQMVFQDPLESLNPRRSVFDSLAEPLLVHGLAKSHELEGRVAELLDLVGLAADSARRYPFEFSGGQRQRIGIARALSVEPELLVLDEPVSALDVSVQAQILNLLVELQQRRGLSYLFISHDMEVVRYLSDDVAVMQQGRVIEYSAAAEFFADPKQEYSRSLLADLEPVVGAL